MKKLLVVLIASMLLIAPAMAMDTLFDNDMENVSGQAGVTIGFGGDQVTEVSFDSLSWGDPDGLGAGTTAGYFILDGTIGVTVTINAGETLAIDVATVAGATTINSVAIPAGTFVALSLPNQTIAIDTPDMFVLGLGSAASTITGTIGTLTLENLQIDVTQASTIYIWAHN